jgi:hypothetical protein
VYSHTAHTHTRTHANKHELNRLYSYAAAQLHSCTHQEHSNAYSDTSTLIYTCKNLHMHASIHYRSALEVSRSIRMHTHACKNTHTHIHAYTRTYIHTNETLLTFRGPLRNPRAYIHACMHAHTCITSHIYMRAQHIRYTHTCRYINSHPYTHTHTHTLTHTHTHTHTQYTHNTHTHMPTHTHTQHTQYTYTHTYMYIQTTHTHSHTYTRNSVRSPRASSKCSLSSSIHDCSLLLCKGDVQTTPKTRPTASSA